jgi:hypothetical protein
MSANELKPSDDMTPEQRRQQIIAILARAVMRRVRWLRTKNCAFRRRPHSQRHHYSGKSRRNSTRSRST